jgi:hypothetical protein
MSDSISDPLIAPRIAALSAQLRAGKLPPEDRAKPYSGIWPRVPDGLLPFIKSPSLEKLAEVLKAHPGLYWHPLIVRQVWQLVRLSWDQTEWDRLGWLIQHDENDVPSPPKEAQEAHQQLMGLIEAHAGGLVRRRVKWKELSRKTGPKGKTKNPHPAMPGDEWIDSRTLAEDFKAVHDRINVAVDEVKKEKADRGGWTHEDKECYRDSLLRVLKASGIEWSGLAYENPKTPAAEPAPSEEAALYFSDADFSELWEFADVVIGDTIRKKLDEADPLVEKQGIPFSLAYALLAALLEASPVEIKDKIENYRRKKKTSKPKPTSS